MKLASLIRPDALQVRQQTNRQEYDTLYGESPVGAGSGRTGVAGSIRWAAVRPMLQGENKR